MLIQSLKNNWLSIMVFFFIFNILTYSVQIVFNANNTLKIAQEKRYYQTVDMVEFLDASLRVSLDDDVFFVTFSRNAPFNIPATQEQYVQIFCNGFPYKLRHRDPFSINIDKGLNNVSLSYFLSQWGRENAPDDINGCTLNITRRYVLVLPYNIHRTMELKATYIIK